MTSPSLNENKKTHYNILIIGGGTGGIATAARLVSKLGAGKVAIIEPADTHYYQPLYTLIAAGEFKLQDCAKPMADLIPDGVDWIKNTVQEIVADKNQLILGQGMTLTYDYLVISSGLQLAWERIKGAKEALGQNGVTSIYEKNLAEKTFDMLNNVKKGNALFIMPPVPIKCAGAPQKIMYLADDIFRRNKVKDQVDVHFYSNSAAIFGIPVFAKALQPVADNRNIKTHFQHLLKEIKGPEKIAVFEKTSPAGVETVEVKYEFLHVVPPQKISDYLGQTKLVHSDGPHKGWLRVDFFTLQHLDYPNIFGIGDCTGVPNSKTGAAIRKMAPVVVKNLIAQMKGQELKAKYDGYASCPLVTGFGKMMLIEFGYDSVPMPTFPFDQLQERYSMWILKKYILPRIYWWGMMKGLM